MNINVFSLIAASAISATVALPASASSEAAEKRLHVAHSQSYTPQYLQQSAHFHAALDHARGQ